MSTADRVSHQFSTFKDAVIGAGISFSGEFVLYISFYSNSSSRGMGIGIACFKLDLSVQGLILLPNSGSIQFLLFFFFFFPLCNQDFVGAFLEFRSVR